MIQDRRSLQIALRLLLFRKLQAAVRALSQSLFLQQLKIAPRRCDGCPRQCAGSVNASEPCSCSRSSSRRSRSQAFILHLRSQSVNFAHKSLISSIARRKALSIPHSEKQLRAAEWATRRRLSSIAVDVALDAVDDHFERDQILAALEHDKISIFFARLNELLVHGLDRCKILAEHGIELRPRFATSRRMRRMRRTSRPYPQRS